MDVVDGNCVLCTQNAVVVNSLFCKQFLGLLKAHYFEVNKEDFKQFSKLFESRKEVHSFCVPCAIKLSAYFETRNACNDANKTGTSSRTCSHCNNTDYITKCSKQLNDDFEFVFKGIKKATRNTAYACLRCLLCINAFKEIKESITKLLNPEESEDSESVESVSEENINMKKSKLKSPKVATTPQSLRKRRNNDDNHEIVTSKRLKTNASKWKKSSRRSPNVLDRILKHLNNVNTETVDRDMHLSYQVVTDQKLMFDIPFVNCNMAESPKLTGKSRRQKAKKLKRSNDEEVVIDISSTDEHDESDTAIRSASRKSYITRNIGKSQKHSLSATSGNDSETTPLNSRPKRNASQKSTAPITTTGKTRKKAQLKRVMLLESSDDESEISSKRMMPSKVSKEKSTPKSPRVLTRGHASPVAELVFKTPKLKNLEKSPQKKNIKYQCNKCAKILKMKYMVVLHELEHDCSYSPMINVEQRDLLVLKENLKLKKNDETELETDAAESTEIEKEIDTMDTEENEVEDDVESLKLTLDDEKEDEEKEDEEKEDEKKDDEEEEDEKNENEEEKDATDKEIDASNEFDESNEKQEEKVKMDVSTENDVAKTDNKQVTESTDEEKDTLNEEDEEESTLDEIVESHKEAGKDKSPEKQNDSEASKIVDDDDADDGDVKDTPETEKENTDDNEEDAVVVESPTDETPTQEIDKNDGVIVVVRSPIKLTKNPSPKKSNKDVSPKKKDNIEQEKETMEADNSSDKEESATNEVVRSPEKTANKQNGSNDEDTDTADQVKSPKKNAKTPSPKKRKDLNENGDEIKEQEEDTPMEVDDDAPKRTSKSPSPPKRAKSASPKKQKDLNENGEETKEQEEDTPMEVDADDDAPKRAKSVSPKKQKDLNENGDETKEPEKDSTIEDIDDNDDDAPKRAKSASPKKVDGTSDNTDVETDKVEELKDATNSEENSKDIPKESDKKLSPISSDNESNTEPNDNASKGSDFSDNDNEQSEDKKQKSNGFTGCDYDEFTLKLSSSEESNSPDKKNQLTEENTNSLHKTSEQDTFQIVEKILQNLGA